MSATRLSAVLAHGWRRAAAYALAAEVAAMLVLALIARRFAFRHALGGTSPGAVLECLPGDVMPAAPTVLRLRRMLARVGRLVPGAHNCLVQAVAARWLLRRRGLGCVLHLGVARVDGRLVAHAWVEAGGGLVCGGDMRAAFQPLGGFAQQGQHGENGA